MNNELLERINADEGINLLRNVINNISVDPRRHIGNPARIIQLAGGAVVDILEGRKPKDYDLVNAIQQPVFTAFRNAGFEFVSDSRTAITYKRNNLVVQFLKVGYTQFEYTISQSRYSFDKNELTLDEDAWNNKVLIPTIYTRYMAENCLSRVPHWEKKGYKLPEITYLSLIKVLAGKDIGGSRPYYSATADSYSS